MQGRTSFHHDFVCLDLLYKYGMRFLFGCKVPAGALMVDLKAHLSGSGRARSIYRGSIDENGQNTLTEDSIIDAVSGDVRFWEWVQVQQRAGRLLSPNSNGQPGVIRLRVSVSFLNQDGSASVIDAGTGSTSYSCPESWEFHKSLSEKHDLDPLNLVHELTRTLIEQQKAMPDIMVRMFEKMTENGRIAIQSSAQESAKILAAIVDPLKSQLALIEKHSTHESTRADKASDCVIRMLNANAESKGWTGGPDQWVNTIGGAVTVLEKISKLTNKG